MEFVDVRLKQSFFFFCNRQNVPIARLVSKHPERCQRNHGDPIPREYTLEICFKKNLQAANRVAIKEMQRHQRFEWIQLK